MNNNSLRQQEQKEHAGKQQKEHDDKCAGKRKADSSRVKETGTLLRPCERSRQGEASRFTQQRESGKDQNRATE